MLGKSRSNFSQISVMSSTKQKDKLLAGSRMSPMGNDTVRSGNSSKKNSNRVF